MTIAKCFDLFLIIPDSQERNICDCVSENLDIIIKWRISCPVLRLTC